MDWTTENWGWFPLGGKRPHPVSFPEGKPLGHEAGSSAPSSVQFKKWLVHTSTSPYVFIIRDLNLLPFLNFETNRKISSRKLWSDVWICQNYRLSLVYWGGVLNINIGHVAVMTDDFSAEIGSMYQIYAYGVALAQSLLQATSPAVPESFCASLRCLALSVASERR